MKNNHTVTFHEIQVSHDNTRWARAGQFDDTPEGLRKMKEEARKLKSNTRWVRLTHITKKVKILEMAENKAVQSTQEIKELLEQGKRVLANIPGIMVNEGFSIGFGSDGISHSPTRVSVSYHAPTVLGKIPTYVKNDEASKLARANWNAAAVEGMKQALAASEILLKAAGMRYLVGQQQIVLLPK